MLSKNTAHNKKPGHQKIPTYHDWEMMLSFLLLFLSNKNLQVLNSDAYFQKQFQTQGFTTSFYIKV